MVCSRTFSLLTRATYMHIKIPRIYISRSHMETRVQQYLEEARDSSGCLRRVAEHTPFLSRSFHCRTLNSQLPTHFLWNQLFSSAFSLIRLLELF